jgi:hypothetical protein
MIIDPSLFDVIQIQPGTQPSLAVVPARKTLLPVHRQLPDYSRISIQEISIYRNEAFYPRPVFMLRYSPTGDFSRFLSRIRLENKNLFRFFKL